MKGIQKLPHFFYVLNKLKISLNHLKNAIAAVGCMDTNMLKCFKILNDTNCYVLETETQALL